MANFRILTLSLLVAACGSNETTPPDNDRVAIGTWGGDNVGMLVTDSVAHIHVGCTNGYFRGVLALRASRFEADGSYILRAHPVAVGPPLPAHLAGSVSGNQATFTVTVNDTVEKKIVTLGPSIVVFGREPRMGPCPICRMPQLSTRF